MSNLIYDAPKLKEMQYFLSFIYQIFYQNHFDQAGDKQCESIVYNELCRFGLKPQDLGPDRALIDNGFLFDKWLSRNYRLGYNDMFVSPDWQYFLQIVNENNRPFMNEKLNFIKLYIPLDYANLYEGVNQIFDFLRSRNIRHMSKVSKMVRSDNVIIRLGADDEKSAQEIINYINANPNLKKGLNTTNPFVPNVAGIGYMHETGISYNSQMSRLIVNYIKECIKLAKSPILSDFTKWLVKNNVSKGVEDIFFKALGSRQLDHDLISEFDEICRVTLLNHNEEQLAFALKNVFMNNNFGGFSRYLNGDNSYNYRESISKYSQGNILFLLRESLERKGKKLQNPSIAELIQVYSKALSECTYKDSVDNNKTLI